MSDAGKTIAVLGGTGYVAGELLRLIAGHPDLALAGVSSGSKAGQLVTEVFPHLSAILGGVRFVTPEDLVSGCGTQSPDGLFCAAPHGVAAGLIQRTLDAFSEEKPCIVDVSADFRFRDVERYESIYGHNHGAPNLLDSFSCAVPEHLAGTQTANVAHPGCFATSVLLAIVPLLRASVVDTEFFVSGITGSTGSGKSPLPTTHHPQRHSNLFAYRPLQHRHAPEIETLCRAACGHEPKVNFVPHSGPFARGIHATVQGRLAAGTGIEDLRTALTDAYDQSPLVEIIDGQARIKDVVGSNRARIGLAVSGQSYALMCVIDNLGKGAAGGAMQWMNRLLGLEETTGLMAPGPGWT